MGIYFGKTKVALYKLTAVYMAPWALGLMIAVTMGDDAVGKVVATGASILLFWGTFTFLFRIKAWQTLVCVACIILVRFIVAMCIVGAVLGLIGSRGSH